ncbi:MAG: hypothetical protein KAW89_09935 [Armatimonadetes bacterium]|nr:hypothetical protein [Armatimonadota bacterium]
MLLLIIAVVGLVVLVRIYHLMLQNRQLTLLLEERRLLIERGVTDLPPLQLPEMRAEKASRSTLIAGIVLMLVSVAWLVSAFFLTSAFWSGLGPTSARVPLGLALGPGVIIGAVGLLLLVIHAVSSAVSSYYERRDRDQQELSGPENAAVIEVDIEE